MSKPVAAVLVATLLALVAATVWVPTVGYSANTGWPPPGHWVDRWQLITRTAEWHRWQGEIRVSLWCWSIRWLPLVVQQAAVVLLGGVLLNWTVRRDRRRRPEATA